MKRLLGPSWGALVLGQGAPVAVGGDSKLPTGGGTGRKAVRRAQSVRAVFERPGDDERPRPGENWR